MQEIREDLYKWISIVEGMTCGDGNEKNESVGLDAVHQNGIGNRRQRHRNDEDVREGRGEGCDVDNFRRTRQRIGENGGGCKGYLEVGVDGDDSEGDNCDQNVVRSGHGNEKEV